MQFHNLGVVTNFINWVVQNPRLGVLALIAVSPLSLTVFTAKVIERRRARPLLSSYALSSVFLSGASSIVLIYTSDVDIGRWRWWMQHGPIVTLCIVLIFYLLMRKIFDGPMYEMTPGATANSASKIIYDVSAYIIYPYTLILMGLPTIVDVLRTGDVASIIAGAVMPLLLIVYGSFLPMLDSQTQRAQLYPDDCRCWYRRALNYVQRTVFTMRGGNPSDRYEAITTRYLHQCSENELYSLRKRTESTRRQAMENIDNAEGVVLRTEEELAAIDAALLDKATTSNND